MLWRLVINKIIRELFKILNFWRWKLSHLLSFFLVNLTTYKAYSPISIFNSLSPSNYSIYITDSVGCNSDTTIISLTQPTAINLNLSSTPESDTGYFDGTATVNINGGTPPYTILWSNSQTDSTIVYLSTGIYSVTVTDANGCFISDSVFVESFVGINQNSQLLNSYIYPNPSNGSFSIIAN